MQQENLIPQRNIKNIDKKYDERYQISMIDGNVYDERDQISKNDELKVTENIEFLKLLKLISQKKDYLDK